MIAIAAGVIVAATVILASLLVRFRQLAQEADRSTRLAKDIWDSANTRFSVLDARIIDLMAKTEVIMARWAAPQNPSQSMSAPSSSSPPTVGVVVPGPMEAGRAMAVASSSIWEGTDTDAKVLRLLSAGPKSSAQIKDEIGRSREHTARLMKGLFDRGFVVRNDRHKPYVYEITDSGRSYVAS